MLAPHELIERYTGRGLGAFLLRGAAGAALLALGLWIAPAWPLLGLLVALSALIPIGGCPACWLGGTIGAACEWRPPRKAPPA
jgi:predicted PurR-regulated permease PerM